MQASNMHKQSSDSYRPLVSRALTPNRSGADGLRCQVGWVVIVLEDHGAGHAPNVDNMGWVAVSVASSLHEQPQAGKSK